MNVLRAIKVAELRKKLAIIPGKILMALLVMVGYYLFRNKTWDLTIVWGQVKTDWLDCIRNLVFIYGAISYFTFFLMLIKQWFLGLIVSVVTVVVLYFTVGTRDFQLFMMILFVLVMIGPIFDIIHFFRYFSLKNKVIEAEEEMQQNIRAGGHDSAYDDGFEEGYRRGINAERRRSIAGRPGEIETQEDDYGEYGNEIGTNSDDWDSGEYIEDFESSDSYGNSYDEDGYGDDGYREDGYGDDGYSEDGYGEDGYREDGYGDDGYREDGYGEDGYGGDGYREDDYGRDGYNDGGSSAGKRAAQGASKPKKPVAADSGNVAGYFADCKTEKEIKRRYHDLCKVYHPDSGNASSDIFCRINAEYVKLMSKY